MVGLKLNHVSKRGPKSHTNLALMYWLTGALLNTTPDDYPQKIQNNLCGNMCIYTRFYRANHDPLDWYIEPNGKIDIVLAPSDVHGTRTHTKLIKERNKTNTDE